MAENYRHFPHPVLSNYRDDYLDSSFNIKLDTQHIGDQLIFTISCTLENEDLKRLVFSNSAKIICRVESSHTMYREIFNLDLGENKVYINESILKGRIDIEIYIIAIKNINNFSSNKFHSDYNDLKFNLSKSDVLAIGEKFNLRLDKDMEELYNIPSIFLISRVDDDNQEMRINIEGDKINIMLSHDDFIMQQNLITRPIYQPIIHSIIIMPALIYLFTELKNEPDERFEELSEKRWFRSIDGVLRKAGLTLDKFDISQETPYKLAQLILDYPINRALNSLSLKAEEE